jgi:hypothetical protein
MEVEQQERGQLQWQEEDGAKVVALLTCTSFVCLRVFLLSFSSHPSLLHVLWLAAAPTFSLVPRLQTTPTNKKENNEKKKAGRSEDQQPATTATQRNTPFEP